VDLRIEIAFSELQTIQNLVNISEFEPLELIGSKKTKSPKKSPGRPKKASREPKNFGKTAKSKLPAVSPRTTKGMKFLLDAEV
jgi:hypothetical protein